MINKITLLIGLMITLGLSSFSQASINWMSFEEAVAESKKGEVIKPVFIDVYTDWCGWCKRMDQTTFADPNTAAFINANFWPIKIDAEMKDTVIFNGDTLMHIPEMGRRGTHLLAAKLLGGQMSYPTYVVLDHNFGMIERIKGYKSVEDLNKKLRSYFKN